ncbi:MAG TPA: MATE family efflux transporter [Caulobacterales bacterium]|nr:MATE family efflux transporter [Caulobacterales bacterium]
MSAPRPYVRDLLRLAGPVALARLGIIGMGLADVVVVGQLAPKELPHQALGWAPTGLFLVSGIGLLTGVQVLAARVIGEKTPESAGVVLRRGLVLALFAGAISASLMWLGGERLFTIFGIAPDLAAPSARVMNVLALSIPLHLFYIAATYFLEAIKRPAISTAVMWTANLVNLGFNLLWVPEHGAVGSAWATVAARVFLAGATLTWIMCMRGGGSLGLHRLGGEGPNYRALLDVGAAAAVSQAVEAGAFTSMSIVAGRLGAGAVAAYQILLNLLALVFMAALGLAAAATVLVSEATGRGAPGDAARAGWTALGLNACVMLFAGAIVFAFPDAIAHAYTADAALAGLIAANLWLAALVFTPDGAQVVAASSLRARGDNWFPTASHVLAYAVVMPPLGFWLAERQGLGVRGLVLAILVASIVSAAVLLGRWATLARTER